MASATSVLEPRVWLRILGALVCCAHSTRETTTQWNSVIAHKYNNLLDHRDGLHPLIVRWRELREFAALWGVLEMIPQGCSIFKTGQHLHSGAWSCVVYLSTTRGREFSPALTPVMYFPALTARPMHDNQVRWDRRRKPSRVLQMLSTVVVYLQRSVRRRSSW